MNAAVFISHSSKDRKTALTICGALEHRGVRCWIASRDVRPGANFEEAVVQAIRVARVMVLVFTANANNSDEMKKEIVLAGQHRLVVIPVRFVRRTMPQLAMFGIGFHIHHYERRSKGNAVSVLPRQPMLHTEHCNSQSRQQLRTTKTGPFR